MDLRFIDIHVPGIVVFLILMALLSLASAAMFVLGTKRRWPRNDRDAGRSGRRRLGSR